MALSVAELNAMPRGTPTGDAEATYRREVAAKAAAALQTIPDPRATYRPTIDASLLWKLAEAAYQAELDRHIGSDWRASLRAVIEADLDRRFPPHHMEILVLYGLARAHDRVFIEAGSGDRRHTAFIEPRLLPNGGQNYQEREADVSGHAGLIPPAGAELLAQARHLHVLQGEVRLLHAWPGKFKATRQRSPKWHEIEAAWPILARYLADRRAPA